MAAIAAILTQVTPVVAKIATVAAAIAPIGPQLPGIPSEFLAIARSPIRATFALVGANLATVLPDFMAILTYLPPVAADFSSVPFDVALRRKRCRREPEQEQAGNGRKLLHRLPPRR